MKCVDFATPASLAARGIPHLYLHVHRTSIAMRRSADQSTCTLHLSNTISIKPCSINRQNLRCAGEFQCKACLGQGQAPSARCRLLVLGYAVMHRVGVRGYLTVQVDEGVALTAAYSWMLHKRWAGAVCRHWRYDASQRNATSAAGVAVIEDL